MIRVLNLFGAITFLAITLFIMPSISTAAGLPKGVAVEVLAEYASNTPGVEKILFRKITIKPGSSWTIDALPAQRLCQGTKGVLEVTNHTTGKTAIHKAGERWDTTPGHKVTLANKGTVDHEHLFYTMVVKK